MLRQRAACIQRVQMKFIISIFTQSLMQRAHFRQHFSIARRKNNQLCLFGKFPDWRMLFSPVLFAQINDVRWNSQLTTADALLEKLDVWCSARCVRSDLCNDHFHTFLRFFFGNFIFFRLFNWMLEQEDRDYGRRGRCETKTKGKFTC